MSMAVMGYTCSNSIAKLGYAAWPDCDKKKVSKRTRQELQTGFTMYLDLERSASLPAGMDLTIYREFMMDMSLERLQKFRASLNAELSKSFGILPDFITEPDLEWE